MPYIKSDTREEIDPYVKRLVDELRPLGAGELNYTLTRIVLGVLGHQANYEMYNAVIGVLEAVKLELYRRAVSIYEDSKRDENGEVYF